MPIRKEPQHEAEPAMHRLTLLFALMSSLVVASSTNAYSIQQGNPVPYLADTESWVVTSLVNQRRYQISVALPDEYEEQSAPYPVVYAVDANTQFGTLVETARSLAWVNAIPDLVIVGIGYPVGQGWSGTIVPRTLDLTPTADDAWLTEIAPAYRELGLPELEGGGGAPEFLRFIRNELIPSIEETYNVSETDRALIGHSLGGLFGAHALFNNAGTFRRFVLGSPSLWWDDRAIFSAEESYAEDNSDLQARVFLSVGLLEQGTPGLNRYAMVANLETFAERLRGRGYEGLELATHFFEGETHESVAPATISRGLRAIYRR